MRLSTPKTSLVSFKFFLTFSFLFFVLTGATLAQEGASSASASRTRYLAETGFIPSSREVAVEEFINYHRHQIGRPKAGEAVALDTRWGNDQAFGAGGEAILQVGFSTALANDRQQLPPVNVALVIDKSGSMAEADKMSRVKASLLELVSQLRDKDILSIIVFDTEAHVLLPARTLADREFVKQVIRQIWPGGSTNIHSGLMLGYHEALKNYRKDATNRVILLTDGIANQGVTDPEKIAQDSLLFNREGIDLSTIGVGLDLNKDLLRQLAQSGRGLFHFVADAEDIEKVFIREFQSLVSLVATEPNLEINFDSGLKLVQLYGYEPRLQDSGVTLKLDNMNQGLTQVVLLRFRLAPGQADNSRLSVKVCFTYYDVEQKKRIVKKQEAFITANGHRMGDLLKDNEVGKNYSIALLAQAIRDMAAACEARHFQAAENLLTAEITRTIRRYPNLEDKDIARTLLIAKRYQTALQRYNQREDLKTER